MLYVTRRNGWLGSAILSEGRTPTKGVAPDFLGRMIVCAPQAIDRPGDICFGEVAGSFGIEADYAARTGGAPVSTRLLRPLWRRQARHRLP